MAANTVRKITPCIETDIFAAESWLSDMAAKGLHFSESGVFHNIIFKKGEPVERKYRLVPAKYMELYNISEEEKTIYQSAGWHYAGVFKDCSCRVFYTEDKNAEEIYTDREGLEFFYKKQRNKLLVPAALGIGFLLFCAYMFYSVSKGGSAEWAAAAIGMKLRIILATGIILLAYAAVSFANVISLKRRIKTGQLEHDVKYGARLAFGRGMTLVLVLLWLVMLFEPVIEYLI